MVMATGKIKNPIKKKTVTGTTSATGAIAIGLGDKIFVSAVCTNVTTAVCLLRGDDYLTIRSPNDLSAVVNRDVTIDVYYYD